MSLNLILLLLFSEAHFIWKVDQYGIWVVLGQSLPDHYQEIVSVSRDVKFMEFS